MARQDPKRFLAPPLKDIWQRKKLDAPLPDWVGKADTRRERLRAWFYILAGVDICSEQQKPKEQLQMAFETVAAAEHLDKVADFEGTNLEESNNNSLINRIKSVNELPPASCCRKHTAP